MSLWFDPCVPEPQNVIVNVYPHIDLDALAKAELSAHGLRCIRVAHVEPESEGMKMTPMISNPHHRVNHTNTQADRTTLWLLLVVVAALVIALTFSDAHGALML